MRCCCCCCYYYCCCCCCCRLVLQSLVLLVSMVQLTTTTTTTTDRHIQGNMADSGAIKRWSKKEFPPVLNLGEDKINISVGPSGGTINRTYDVTRQHFRHVTSAREGRDSSAKDGLLNERHSIYPPAAALNSLPGKDNGAKTKDSRPGCASALKGRSIPGTSPMTPHREMAAERFADGSGTRKAKPKVNCTSAGNSPERSQNNREAAERIGYFVGDLGVGKTSRASFHSFPSPLTPPPLTPPLPPPPPPPHHHHRRHRQHCGRRRRRHLHLPRNRNATAGKMCRGHVGMNYGALSTVATKATTTATSTAGTTTSTVNPPTVSLRNSTPKTMKKIIKRSPTSVATDDYHKSVSGRRSYATAEPRDSQEVVHWITFKSVHIKDHKHHHSIDSETTANIRGTANGKPIRGDSSFTSDDDEENDDDDDDDDDEDEDDDEENEVEVKTFFSANLSDPKWLENLLHLEQEGQTPLEPPSNDDYLLLQYARPTTATDVYRTSAASTSTDATTRDDMVTLSSRVEFDAYRDDDDDVEKKSLALGDSDRNFTSDDYYYAQRSRYVFLDENSSSEDDYQVWSQSSNDYLIDNRLLRESTDDLSSEYAYGRSALPGTSGQPAALPQNQLVSGSAPGDRSTVVSFKEDDKHFLWANNHTSSLSSHSSLQQESSWLLMRDGYWKVKIFCWICLVASVTCSVLVLFKNRRMIYVACFMRPTRSLRRKMAIDKRIPLEEADNLLDNQATV